MAVSLISSDINFDADGKHAGYLRLPHSVHESAYGRILIPLVMVNNGPGPTTLLMAGNHGDEYEAQIALTKLCRELEHSDIRGRLIILTMANFAAAEAGLRTSPLDGGNLNRSFPGDAHGTPTQMIAEYVENTLLPMCDYLIDLHSGGSSLFYPPTLLRGLGQTPEESEMLVALQTAFDAPYAWVFTSGGGRNSTARTAMGAANRNGVISVMAELGGGGYVSRDILALTERGIKRMLACVGMLPNYSPDAANGTAELTIVQTLVTHCDGLFEPLCDVEDHVAAGDPAAAIHYPEDPWRAPTLLHFAEDGMVLCKRVPGRIKRGDCLFQVAQPL